MMTTTANERGVTLIETLVALAVMGLAAASLLTLVGQNTQFAAMAQDRAYASIAADNLMVETLARSGPIETGETLGELTFASRDWRYRRRVAETGVAGLFRVDIEILDGDGDREQVIATAVTLREAR